MSHQSVGNVVASQASQYSAESGISSPVSSGSVSCVASPPESHESVVCVDASVTAKDDKEENKAYGKRNMTYFKQVFTETNGESHVF